ncbi:hypothetical protein AGMMS50255_1500 [Spirochaetia bacterium]|nr:hypothetical protein AGMMS50255_1500 [Spirochaetia bacterium]
MAYNNSLPIYHVAFSECEQLNFLNIYDMLELVKKGKLSKETYVWKKGMNQWVKAGKVPDLKPLFDMPPCVPKELEEQLRWPVYDD